MKSINNIDELLKNSFNGFEATPPPNAWSGIQQGISNTPTIHSQHSVSNTATIVKSASIITKVVIAAATSGVILSGSFIAYKYLHKTEIAQTKNVVQQTQTSKNIEQKVDEKLPEQDQKIKNIQSKIVAPSTQQENQKVDNISDEKLNQPIVDNGNKPEVINSSNTLPNQPKTVVPQAQKIEQKQALPKPKHNFSAPENTVSSNSNTTDENNYVAPKIGNSFSPNGDGINDKFDIEIENESYFDFKIYDNQNRLVFESDSKEKMWNGTKMNVGDQCDGLYNYVFNYKFKNSEKLHTAKGVVEIIREKD